MVLEYVNILPGILPSIATVMERTLKVKIATSPAAILAVLTTAFASLSHRQKPACFVTALMVTLGPIANITSPMT